MTDFRVLCAEGVAFIWSATDPDDLSINAGEWAEKVNAALIETDEELAKLFAEVYHSGKGERWRAYIRVLLARCGNHPAISDSSTHQPVPVSERWPEFSDCDNAERVWCWNLRVGAWRLSRIDMGIHSHWLPARALPLPTND